MKVKAHVIVSGRVQGVFFRFETQNVARKYNVNGWVRNIPDGKVEAVFEGEKENVNKVIEFCKRGPSGAKVTGIEINWQDYEGEFKDFEIRYF